MGQELQLISDLHHCKRRCEELEALIDRDPASEVSMLRRQLRVSELGLKAYKENCELMQADIRTGVAGVKSIVKDLGLDKLADGNQFAVMSLLTKLPALLPTLKEKLSPLLPLIEKYGR